MNDRSKHIPGARAGRLTTFAQARSILVRHLPADSVLYLSGKAFERFCDNLKSHVRAVTGNFPYQIVKGGASSVPSGAWFDVLPVAGGCRH